MSLERRLTEALHHADDYEPSVDLFARLSRSIEEDRSHRRRLGVTIGGAVAGVSGAAVFLGMLAGRDTEGLLVFPKWSIQLLLFVSLATCLIVLGPVIRRLGQPYLTDVFHMSPATGDRFSRLLDLAYYLAFGGGILSSVDLTAPASQVEVGGEAVLSALFAAARFVALLGLAHAGNLLLLPVIGLLFSSITRLARRRAAGIDAPPISRKARTADRLASGIVLVAVLLAIAGVLLLIALGLIGGLD